MDIDTFLSKPLEFTNVFYFSGYLMGVYKGQQMAVDLSRQDFLDNPLFPLPIEQYRPRQSALPTSLQPRWAAYKEKYKI